MRLLTFSPKVEGFYCEMDPVRWSGSSPKDHDRARLVP
jgi:hypothetical protein